GRSGTLVIFLPGKRQPIVVARIGIIAGGRQGERSVSRNREVCSGVDRRWCVSGVLLLGAVAVAIDEGKHLFKVLQMKVIIRGCLQVLVATNTGIGADRRAAARFIGGGLIAICAAAVRGGAIESMPAAKLVHDL